MASPAVAIPNGVPTPMQLDNDVDPAQSVNVNVNVNASTKRKRESSDADDNQPNGANGLNGNGTVTINADAASTTRIDQSTLRDYYEVLESYDTTPSILKRPLLEFDHSDEPEAKRKKSDDATRFPSIAEKVANEEYEDAEAIINDIKNAITARLFELRNVEPEKDPNANDEAIAHTLEFKEKAYGLFRGEMTYPKSAQPPDVLRDLDATNDLQSNASGHMVLSVYGEAPKGRHLYSSLQQPVVAPDNPAGAIRPLKESTLPSGIKTTKTIPFSFPSAAEKDKKSKTLGELFPAPRNLPSLQPPKAPKSTTKGVQVGWHRPELTEKSKYRSGSYFSQTISTGRWLDYSNAAPPSQIMTKQRERALSLAGNKPSSSDLEMTEMEALFRGAFSSFAPSKDDSAAMISSGLISHTLWWQRAGKRSFDRLVEAELPEEPVDQDDNVGADVVEEVDEELLESVIKDWDENMVDPNLEEACCPKKPEDEKDVDDILQDVSDMIQTLISYQKNRNLTLPTASSQSRYAADPAHSDMLKDGSPVQPGDEETSMYQTLKAQLVLVIKMLPPYAVARLNSDKLEELNISTKMEIRTDEVQGIMEEDEVAARARAAQAAATGARPASHRASSSSSTMQYGQQYHPTPNRGAMPSPQYNYAQTPPRPTQPSMPRPPQTMPAAYPPRPPSNTGYRPPSAYQNTGYAQQFAKPQASFSQPVPYAGTPTQTRPAYQQMPPGYPNMGSATPQARYPSYSHTPNTQPPAYHHQPYQAQHQQHGSPTHTPYAQHTNGAGPMPQRTASPHVPYQQPQHPHMVQPGYNPSPTPSRHPSYGSQPNMGNDPSRRYYPPAGAPAMTNNQRQHQHQPHNQGQGQSNPANMTFHTSLNPSQVQQAMSQAKARFNANQSAMQSNEGLMNAMPGQGQVGAPVGLGGIGLGADPTRMAAARVNMPNVNYAAASPSPKPQANSPAIANASAPPAVNGSPAMATTAPTANGGITAAGREA